MYSKFDKLLPIRLATFGEGREKSENQTKVQTLEKIKH